MKDALRCTNKQTEMIRSDADGTQRLERLLSGELGLPIEQVMDTVVVQPLDEIVIEPTASQALLVWFRCHLSDEYLQLGKGIVRRN